MESKGIKGARVDIFMLDRRAKKYVPGPSTLYMASTGATFADFVQGKSVTARWTHVAEKLLTDASTVFTVTLAKE